MKKATVFLLLIFSSLSVFAQNIRKATFRNEELFVYPYPAEERNPEIVPYFGALPDGKYLIYFKPYYRYKFSLWKMKKIKKYSDSTKVAIVFSIKDHKKEGPACYFNPKKDTIDFGNYVNDEKEGGWKTYYSSKSAEKNWKLSYYIEYKSGIQWGKELSYSKKGILLNEEMYNDGERSGTQRYYHPNGKLKKEVEYNPMDTGNPAKPYFNYALLLNEVQYIPSEITRDYSRKNGHSRAYAENGTRLYDVLYGNGNILYFDTLYWEGGKPRFILTKLEPNVENENALFKGEYFSLGQLTDTYWFKGTSLVAKCKYGLKKDTVEYLRIPDLEYVKSQKEKILIYSRNGKYTYLEPQSGILINEYHSLTYNGTIENLSFDTTSKILRYTYVYKTHNGDLTRKTDFIFKGIPIEFTLQELVDFSESNEYKIKNKLEKESIAHMNPEELEVFYHNATRTYYKENPFSGTLEYRDTKNKKLKGKIIAEGDYLTLYSMYGTEYSQYSVIEMKNGFKHGYVRDYNDNFIMQESHFQNGKYDGNKLQYELEYLRSKQLRQELKKCGKKFKGKKVYYLKRYQNYANDKLNGDDVRYYRDGSIAEFSHCENGKKNGAHEEYASSGHLTNYVEYKKGLPHGKAMSLTLKDNYYYNKSTKKYETVKSINHLYVAEFNHGKPNGNYNHYLKGETMNSGQFENGFLTGTWKQYYAPSNGTKYLKYSYEINKEDSISPSGEFYKQFSIPNPNGENTVLVRQNARTDYDGGINLSFSHFRLTGYLKNGNIGLEGELKNRIHAGNWKVYDENKILISSIDYSKQNNQLVLGGDNIRAEAWVEEFYSNGKKRSEGWSIYDDMTYNCVTELSVPNPHIRFVNYFDPNGIQTLINGNGHFIEYDHMGRKKAEGEMLNYKKTGGWKEFNTEGSLSGIGMYVEGEKDGKWYEGDLSGLHLEDQTCFDMSDPYILSKLEYAKKNINITETTFNKGEILKTETYDINLNITEKTKNRRRRGHHYPYHYSF